MMDTAGYTLASPDRVNGHNDQKPPETHDKKIWTLKTSSFFLKDNKSIYTKRRPYMGLCSC